MVLKIMVTGIDTGVGKTVVSAILTTLLKGDYWKPIQCGEGEQSDIQVMTRLVDIEIHRLYAPAYALKAPLSPHQAAQLENIAIDLTTIHPPQTSRPLIIEGVGGIFVPLTLSILTIDLFKTWNCQWILVSKNYLGSINHTLLTLDALKRQQIPVLGLIFNGEPNPESERAILDISQTPFLGRVLPEKNLTIQTIQRYAKQWNRHQFPTDH